MNIRVRDENGDPSPAVLGVAVVDEASLSLDPNERPTMTTHFWLTNEVATQGAAQASDDDVRSSASSSSVPERVIAAVSRFTEGVFRGESEPQPEHAWMPTPITKEQLQQLLATRGLDAEQLADRIIDELRFPVREYAHLHLKDAAKGRDDFAETLLWQPLLITDSNGEATVRFDLSDSVTAFRVLVDGHSIDGRIGSAAVAVTSRLPFQLEPKLPSEVTTGDRIDCSSP